MKILILLLLSPYIFADDYFWPTQLITERINSLEQERLTEVDKWTKLLKEKEELIAYVNSSGGLKEGFGYTKEILEKYKGMKIDGILISGSLYFSSPRVISIDNILSQYYRYRDLQKESKEISNETDRIILKIVNFDMENYKTNKAASLVEKYLNDRDALAPTQTKF